MKKIQILLMVLSLICLIWFMLPLALSAGLNIGNLTGIGISALLFLYAVFMPKVHHGFTALKAHSVGKWLCPALFALLLLITGLVITETACMIIAANRAPGENATAVVLGCRVYGEKPSLSMTERLDAARDYLLKNKDAVCILSGGQGPGEDITEAECMYRYLINLGIEPERLYKEEQSVSTRENLYFSRQLTEKYRLNPSIAIVTSEYHEYRAGKIAETLNIEYGAVPARTALWLFPTYYVRELYGILYEWLL
ncbi:MAG: YdcF family protein [Lachnospiraceae bacterium]